MAKIVFTQQEINEIIRVYYAGHNEWNKIRLGTIKSKIKTEKSTRQNDFCCYCRRDIHNEFRLVLDIEHVLPKSKIIKHMFTSKNISVSCKRCNMNVKGDDVSFLSMPIDELPKRVFRSKYYKIIHPNLDKYNNHLVRIAFQVGDEIFVKYFVKNRSEKGIFTREYFRLTEFERNSSNRAQGGSGDEVNNPYLLELLNSIVP